MADEIQQQQAAPEAAPQQQQQGEGEGSSPLQQAHDAKKSRSERAYEILQQGFEGEDGKVAVSGEQQQEDEEAPQQAEQETGNEERSQTFSEVYARSLELEQEVRQLRKQLKGREAAGSSSELQELARRDPAAALGQLGIGVDEALELLMLGGSDGGSTEPINNPALSTEHKTPAEVEELRQQLEELKGTIQSQNMQQLVHKAHGEIDAVASRAPDKWEFVKGLRNEGSYDLVLQTAVEIHNSSGETPSYEEVLDLVDKHLQESLEQDAARLSRFERIRSKFNGGTPEQQKQEAVREAVRAAAPSNGANGSRTTLSGSAGSTPVPTRALDKKARFNRMLEILSSKGD